MLRGDLLRGVACGRHAATGTTDTDTADTAATADTADGHGGHGGRQQPPLVRGMHVAQHTERAVIQPAVAVYGRASPPGDAAVHDGGVSVGVAHDASQQQRRQQQKQLAAADGPGAPPLAATVAALRDVG
jgi:hypothetical protein